MDDDKTAEKTAVSPLNGAAIPLGAHSGNTGGKPGRSGRKPDAFKRRMAALATWTDKAGFLESVLSDIHHAHWMRALEYVTERGYGKVAQGLEVSGKDGKAVPFTFNFNSPDGDSGI